jgi:hypothetical protein
MLGENGEYGLSCLPFLLATGGESLASLMSSMFLRLWSKAEIQRSVEEATRQCLAKVCLRLCTLVAVPFPSSIFGEGS